MDLGCGDIPKSLYFYNISRKVIRKKKKRKGKGREGKGRKKKSQQRKMLVLLLVLLLALALVPPVPQASLPHPRFSARRLQFARFGAQLPRSAFALVQVDLGNVV